MLLEKYWILVFYIITTNKPNIKSFHIFKEKTSLGVSTAIKS